MGNSEKPNDAVVNSVDDSVGLVKTESDAEYDECINRFTPQEQRKIIRRVDIRLTILLGVMYSVSLMDRTNLGIGAITGMTVDLDLVGARYNCIALPFFITYIILQPPATVVIRKIGPRIFLPTITLLWGITMICSGFVKDLGTIRQEPRRINWLTDDQWTQMLALRVVLGVFEAGFFPGSAYLLSCWYPRYELQKRNAVFCLIGALAAAFAGILSYGFSQLKNHGSGPAWWGQLVVPTKTNPHVITHRLSGIAGWRWIFILEGLITCIVGLIAYFFVADFPEHATRGIVKFLSQSESDFIVARIEKDRHDVVAEEFSLAKYLRNALDWKVWGFAFLFCLTLITSYAIAYFLPIILNVDLKFSVGASQCLGAPPFVLAAIATFVYAWYGDKWRLRSPFIILNGILNLIGIALLGYTTNVGVRYFGVFLAAIGSNANISCILTWQANNIRGQWKRAFCSATLVSFGGIGGIIGSTVFRSQDSPTYGPGMLTTMTSSALIIVLALVMDFSFHLANKRVDAGGRPIEGLVGFKYTL